MPDRITMTDVGKQAGVSRTTVDRVLKNKGVVSKAARERIERALGVLGYKVNKYASALKKSIYFKLAVFIPEHKEDSYYDYVEKGIVEEYRKLSYSYKEYTIFRYNPKSEESFFDNAKKIFEQEPSALIFGPVGNVKNITSFVNEIKKRSIPYIIMDSFADNFNPVSFIGQNGKKSGRFLASLLHHCGYNKIIGVVRIIDKNRTIHQQEIDREKGFTDYLNEEAPNSIVNLLQIEENDDVVVSIKRFIQTYPDIDTIITFNSSIGTISDTFKEIKPNIHLIGYDTSTINVEKLKDGKIDFLVCQSPTRQGAEALQIIFDYVVLNGEKKDFQYFPIDLITKENLEYYLSYEARYYR